MLYVFMDLLGVLVLGGGVVGGASWLLTRHTSWGQGVMMRRNTRRVLEQAVLDCPVHGPQGRHQLALDDAGRAVCAQCLAERVAAVARRLDPLQPQVNES